MPTISYLFENAPSPGEILYISHDLIWLRMPLPFILNHVNIWLINDGEKWCVIDTGVHSELSVQLWEKYLKKFSLSKLIVTHYHSDHFGMAGWLCKQTDITLWMSAAEYFAGYLAVEQLGNFSKQATVELLKTNGTSDLYLSLLKGYENYYRQGCPIIPATFNRIKNNDILDIGGFKWRVITCYGHGIEQVTLYSEEKQILIAGDMLLPSITTNIPVLPTFPQADPISDFLTSIQQFLDLPKNTLVLPSHGRPYRGLHSRIHELENYHQIRLEQTLDLCIEPRTAFELVPYLFKRKVEDATQCIFCTGEVIALLNHLKLKGLITKVDDDLCPDRYVKL